MSTYPSIPKVICLVISLTASFLSSSAFAQLRVDVDVRFAQATLQALGNPQISIESAEDIARLPGNQAIIKKITEMGGKASTLSFATALQDAAAGRESAPEYGFEAARKNRVKALAMVTKIAAPKSEFVNAVAPRINEFAPKGISGSVTGYLIAGGPVDGLSFTSPGFYLDVVRLDGDEEAAKQMMAHELFHAVQNLASNGRFLLATEYDLARYAALSKPQRDCYVGQILFGNLMSEGTASLVGDGMLQNAKASKRLEDRLHGSPEAMKARIDLLESLLLAGTSENAVGIDRLYGIGFYSYFSSGRPALYDLGQFMATEIVAQRANQAIGDLAIMSPAAFVKVYQDFAEKSAGKLPPLGSTTNILASESRCSSN